MAIKTFTDYLNEAFVPLEKGHPASDILDAQFDVAKPVPRDLINRTLDVICKKKYITPYVGLNQVAKELAQYGIQLPRFTFKHPAEGEQAFKVIVPGETSGQNKDGTFTPPIIKEGVYYLFFSYTLDDSGFTEIYAELVTADELQELKSSKNPGDNYVEIEEETQIDELSKDTLQKYSDANHNDAMYHEINRDNLKFDKYLSGNKEGRIKFHQKQLDKRRKGRGLVDRAWEKKVKSEETVNELSQRVLHSYANKSTGDYFKQKVKQAVSLNRDRKAKLKAKNRSSGANLAMDKMGYTKPIRD